VAAPTYRLSIVRRKDIGGGKSAWPRVGKISLWVDADGKISGKCTLNHLESEFYVYPDDTEDEDGGEKNGTSVKKRPAYRGGPDESSDR